MRQLLMSHFVQQSLMHLRKNAVDAIYIWEPPMRRFQMAFADQSFCGANNDAILLAIGDEAVLQDICR